MKLEIVNPIDWAGWDDLVESLPNTSAFHTSGWARTLRDSYGYEPRYFVGFNGDVCECMLPMMSVKTWLTGCRGVSLPFTDQCAPYLLNKESFTELFQETVKVGKESGWKFVEFRGGGEHFQSQPPFLTYCGHVLPLTDETELFGNMKDSHRRNIKKALKQNVQVLADDLDEAMEDFYRLNCITRKKHGLPPQPLRFFKNLNSYMLQNGFGKIFRARWQGNTIAAAIFLSLGNRVLYKYGASDLSHLPLRANNLIMWEAIRYYLEEGFEALDLGRSEADNLGLCRYKQGWGSVEHTLAYYRYNLESARFETGKSRENGWYNPVFSRTPMPVLETIGRLAYRHLG